MRSVDTLLEAAQASLDAGRPQLAIEAAQEARHRLAPDDDRHEAALELLVDAFEACDDLPQAVAAQREVIHRGEGAAAQDRGIDFERLGDLLVAQIDRSEDEQGRIAGARRPLRAADEAYRAAHAWYVEANGPDGADAIDALAGRLQVACAANRREDVYRFAMDAAASGGALTGSKRTKKRVADTLEGLATAVMVMGLREPTAALDRAVGVLRGRAPVRRVVVPVEGPPRLALDYPRKGTQTAPGAVGRDAIEARVHLCNLGGRADALTVRCHGPAVAQGLLEAPVITIERYRGGRTKEQRFQSTPDGDDAFVARTKVSLGPAVANRAELDEVGGFDVEAAVERTECWVYLRCAAKERGKAAFDLEIIPANAPAARVSSQVKLKVTRPRAPAKSPAKTAHTAKTDAPRRASGTSTGPIRRTKRNTGHNSAPAPWVRRGETIRRWFEAAEAEVDARLDLVGQVESLDALGQRYVLHVAEHGATTDAAAAATLDVDDAALRAALQHVDALLQTVPPDRDES
ncbi:MAG: hypothetical protein AAF721_28710 [Myxococcota bacterium]